MLPAEVQNLLPKDWERQVVADKWTKLKVDLAVSLASAFVDAASGRHPEKTETAEGLAGFLRLHSLIETLRSDSTATPEARILKSPRDIEFAAVHKAVILPISYFSLCPYKPKFIREPGFTDFYIVRDEWNRYEAGELARVINVLPGETFDVRIRHRDKTETTISTTVDSTTSEQI